MNGRAAILARIASDPALDALLAESRARDAALAVADPTHDTAHALRVAVWAVRLGGDGVDVREAVAAALLHDAVNPPKNSPERTGASERSAAFARERLATLGFAPESVERIAGAIRDHSFSRGATPETPLGDALQDADRLEALGAIGLLRCVSTGVRMGGEWFHGDDPWAESRPLDDTRYSVDHFFTKLLGLPATMRTQAGRVEAAHRANFLRAFLGQLAIELGSEPPGGTMAVGLSSREPGGVSHGNETARDGLPADRGVEPQLVRSLMYEFRNISLVISGRAQLQARRMAAGSRELQEAEEISRHAQRIVKLAETVIASHRRH